MAASRVVSQITTRTQPQRVLQEPLDGRRRIGEVSKAGVFGTDEAPDQAQADQAEHDIAGQRVQAEDMLLGHIGDRKSQHQAPVKDTHECVPDLDGVLCIHGFALIH